MLELLYPSNETVAAVATGSEIGDPLQRRLYDWWIAACAGRAMPPYSAFDPVALPWVLGPISVVSVLDDGDYRYRVDGTRVVDYFGVEMSGKKLSEHPNPTAQKRIGDSFAFVRAAKAPVSVRRDAVYEKRSIRVVLLLLPFAKDSENVSEIISCLATGADVSSV